MFVFFTPYLTLGNHVSIHLVGRSLTWCGNFEDSSNHLFSIALWLPICVLQYASKQESNGHFWVHQLFCSWKTFMHQGEITNKFFGIVLSSFVGCLERKKWLYFKIRDTSILADLVLCILMGLCD